jgi:hypothetical protein
MPLLHELHVPSVHIVPWKVFVCHCQYRGQYVLAYCQLTILVALENIVFNRYKVSWRL